jgi:hypothetical protein
MQAKEKSFNLHQRFSLSHYTHSVKQVPLPAQCPRIPVLELGNRDEGLTGMNHRRLIDKERKDRLIAAVDGVDDFLLEAG